MAITTALIQQLIDKRDTNEVVRDKLAEILLTETASQQQIAAGISGKNPADWKFRVFVDRSNPWEEWLDIEPDDDDADRSPIVNLWLDSMTFSGSKGDTVERQQASGTYFLDCYGLGFSSSTQDGHAAGDQMAAAEAARCLRLVRNILMAGTYAYLDLRKIVAKRWPQSVQMFQPEIDAQSVIKVRGARFTLGVDFNEFSPQYEGQSLESVVVTVRRRETGEVYFAAEYPYVGP